MDQWQRLINNPQSVCVCTAADYSKWLALGTGTSDTCTLRWHTLTCTPISQLRVIRCKSTKHPRFCQFWPTIRLQSDFLGATSWLERATHLTHTHTLSVHTPERILALDKMEIFGCQKQSAQLLSRVTPNTRSSSAEKNSLHTRLRLLTKPNKRILLRFVNEKHQNVFVVLRSASGRETHPLAGSSLGRLVCESCNWPRRALWLPALPATSGYPPAPPSERATTR